MATIVTRYNATEVYTVNLYGNDILVTVTPTSSVVKKWLATALFHTRHHFRRNRLVVGLGVQWTPGGKGQDPSADTLQLCIGRRCLIYQLYQASTVPWKLREFLRNPDVTFVGFWNHSDRKKLELSEHGIKMCRDPIDLRRHAESEDGDYEEDFRSASFEEIVEKCLGFEVYRRKEIGASHWDEKFLSDDQVVYASVDAYCAFLIGRNIRAWKLTGYFEF